MHKLKKSTKYGKDKFTEKKFKKHAFKLIENEDINECHINCDINYVKYLQDNVCCICKLKSEYINENHIFCAKYRYRSKPVTFYDICNIYITGKTTNFRVLKYVYNKVILSGNKLEYISKYDNIRIFKIIHKIHKLKITDTVCANVILLKNVKCIKYVYGTIKTKITRNWFSMVCIHGDLDIVKYFYETLGFRDIGPQLENKNIWNNFENVKYLCEMPNVLDYYGTQINLCRIFTEKMDYAIRHGYLHTVKYLHTVHNIECTQDGIFSAYMYAHIEIVKYLYENMKIKNTKYILGILNSGRNSGSDRHIKIVEYLTEMVELEEKNKYIKKTEHGI